MTGGRAPSPDTVNKYATENPVHAGHTQTQNHEHAVSVRLAEAVLSCREKTEPHKDMASNDQQQ